MASNAKYEDIYRGIREDILSGRLRPGDRVPSERALARERDAGVITAARALSELARDGYVTREIGRGTFVADPKTAGAHAPGAPDDKPAGARRIGVVLVGRRRADPAYSELLGRVVPLATAHSCETRCWELAEMSLLPELHDQLKACDGLLLAGSGGEEIVEELLWLGVPLVLCGINPFSETTAEKADMVEYRYDEGARLAVDHLAELGHTRIGLVNGDLRSERSYADFSEGYRAALAWRHIQSDRRLVRTCESCIDPDLGYEAARKILSIENPPTGVVCVSDRLAYGVLRAASESGLAVPGDLSVVGGESLLASQALDPPLTALKMSGKLAETAMELLVDRLANPERERRTVWLTPELMIRQSTSSARQP